MLEKVQEDRLKKLQAIKELGIDPYGGRYDTAQGASDILAAFEKWEADLGGVEAAKAAVAADPSTGSGQAAKAPTADAAGRLILIRDMGKMMFAHIRDETHDKGIQICLRKNQEGKPPAGLDDTQWKLAKLLDLGDIVAASGEVHRTRTGEITIWADKLTLLTKSLNPMPEKWHGLSDVQTRYRQRYLDLMSNPESLAVFKKRIAIIEHFRSVLHGKGFVEVETPMMQSIYGGAAARPFTTHHNALDIDLFMRISPELYLKRLLVGGMGKVFEINRNFRNEGIDTRHNPEFTMMELYQAYADYEVMMEITEELISGAAERVSPLAEARAAVGEMESIDEELKRLYDALRVLDSHPSAGGAASASLRDIIAGFESYFDRKNLTAARSIEAEALKRKGLLTVQYGEQVIDYTRPWPRHKYYDLVRDHAKIDPYDSAMLRAKARSLGIEESNKDDAVVVNEVFEAVVEPALNQPVEFREVRVDDEVKRVPIFRPVFVMDYPAAICPLTRRKSDDPSIALRFECFIAGMEIANAYTELNDPAVQEENFRQQLRGEAANETMRVMDEDFVTALRHGMPPAGGLGIGIDRVVMLLTNSTSIRDVVLFPLLRPTE